MKTLSKKPANAAEYLKVPPNASRLIHALREMGYDSFSSVLDILDNSIDAKATKVWINVKDVGKGSLVIDITDNGKGMDRDTLAQALRLGSDTVHDVKVDLGKYGMGLVTASISMARDVWVLTRQKGQQAFEAEFNIDVIERHNDFLISLKPASGAKVLDLIGEQGTLVRLSQIDRISDTNVSRFTTALRHQIGQVYRHFIDAGLTVLVNNRAVPANDPLMLSHELTEIVLDQDILLGPGKKARLKVVELPDLGQAGDGQADIFPSNSGFYVVRNGRQIMSAQTFGMYKHHHSYSHFRAELAFNGSLDADFHVDVKKSTILPGDDIRAKLEEKVSRLIAKSGQRGRGRDEPIKLSHSAAESRINALLAPALPPVEAAPAPVLAQVKEGEKPPAPPARLDIIEQAKQQAAEAARQPAKVVEFGEEDGGDHGRFFSTMVKAGCPLKINYNRQHPLIKAVAAKSSPSAILDFISFAMATVEQNTKDGHKFVEAVCGELTKLLAAVEQQPASK